jgi:hypothetical protein
MKLKSLCAALLAAIFYLPSAHAACIDDEGRWVLDCKDAGIQVDEEVLERLFEIIRSPHMALPNLIVSDITTHVFGSAIEVGLEVENIGVRDAAGFELIAAVEIRRADDGSLVEQIAWDESLPGLPVSQKENIYLEVYLPDRDYDYDVSILGVADPVTLGNYGYAGYVLEINESDNGTFYECRVFGYDEGQGNVGTTRPC